MKNSVKYLLMLVLPFLAFACQEKDDYTPGEVPAGPQVYFSGENKTTVSLSSQETSFDIIVARANADAATDVNINTTGAAPLFEVPNKVSFGAGENKANLTVTYDPDKLGFENPVTFTVALDSAVTTPYGSGSLTITASIPAPWTSLGMGTYGDYRLGFEKKCEIQQSDLDPTMFRVLAPYAVNGLDQAVASPELDLWVLNEGDTMFDVEMTEDGIVYFDPCQTGNYNATYSAYEYLLHVVNFKAGSDPAEWAWSKVVEYQENGLPGVIQIAPYYYMDDVGGFNYHTTDEVILIVFPGFVQKDYSVEVSYNGTYTDTDGNPGVMASVAMGADVESVRVFVAASGEENAAIEAVTTDGEWPYAEVTASGSAAVPFASKPADGSYTILAVSYADGEAQKLGDASFKYKAPTAEEETWTAIATGTYTYTIMFGNEDGTPYDDEGLVLWQSDQNPYSYKITHCFYDVDCCFTMLPSGAIVMADQETGAVDSTYGMIYIDDVTDAYGTNEYGVSECKRTYDEAGNVTSEVYNFAVVYYCSAGVFGKGIETFTVTGPAPEEGEGEEAPAMRKPAAQVKSCDKTALPLHTFEIPAFKAIR